VSLAGPRRDLPTVAADAFDDLFLAGTPLLDVRAPVEFARGAFPGATNLPLLDDEERARVGTRYKQAGHDAAVRLGHELVSGATRAARIEAWAAWARAHPDGVLYCFRGGQRSRIAQEWLAEAGATVPRVEGGYKALRAHLLAHLEALGAALPLRVLGGRTGTGKTRLLAELPRSLDLEGLANHRGSAFGPRATPQPPPVAFENALAVRLLVLARDGRERPVAVEDESRNVGRLSVPTALFAQLSASPLALVERSLEERVEITLAEYVTDATREYASLHGEAGFDRYRDYLLTSIDKVRRRLGGERHGRFRRWMEDALALQARTGAVDAHRGWIRGMLEEYYDPMYDHQLAAKADRVAFRGGPQEVVAWLREQTGG
jgi:tRNA 2-selenouridine synthase